MLRAFFARQSSFIDLLFPTEALPFMTSTDQVKIVMDATEADDWIMVDAIKLTGRTLPTGQFSSAEKQGTKRAYIMRVSAIIHLRWWIRPSDISLAHKTEIL